MTRPPRDAGIRDRIRKSLTSSVMVEAGAGTGKTTVLVDRVLEAVKTGHARLDEMAVMTFTEMAAGELRARVRTGLESALRSPDSDTQTCERAQAALDSLTHAPIGTIHSFCASMLREHPVEAGVDPDFRILDAFAAELDADARYLSWLEQIMADPPAPLAAALRRRLGLNQIESIAINLNAHRELIPETFGPCPEADLESLVADFRNGTAELGEAHGSCLDETDKANIAAAVFFGFNDELQCLWNNQDIDGIEQLVLRSSAGDFPIARGNKKNWRNEDALGHKARSKEIRVALREAAGVAAQQLRTKAICDAAGVVAGYVRCAAAERRRSGMMTFDDLMIAAHGLLVSHPDVAAALRRRFKIIFVDEFQDTDPLQAQIALMLTSEPDAGPAPGGLVVVGDPKQSIYRFRRADLGLYDDIKTDVFSDSANTEIHEITENFRSRPAILDWVNSTFASLITRDPGVQPSYEPLNPYLTTTAPPGLAGISGSVHVVTGDTDAANQDAARASEATVLANAIRHAVASEWTVGDDTAVRPATFGDIAVLMPARTNIEIFERAFDEAGIRYRHESGRAFFCRREVVELLHTLRAIVDPGDTYAVYGALTSRAFGCSPADVFDHLCAGGSLAYESSTRRTGGPGRVNAALEVLSVLRHGRYDAPLAAFIENVMRTTHLLVTAASLPGGLQIVANLEKVADMARSFSGSGRGGLRAFVDWLGAHVDERPAEQDGAVDDGAADAVRIFTMHSAKGLEFPIVALANLDGSRGTSIRAIADHAARTVHLRVGNANAGYYETPGMPEAAEREAVHVDAENRRLLYVAATRAEDHLIIPVAHKARSKTGAGGPSGMLDLLIDHLPPTSVLEHITDPEPTIGLAMDTSLAEPAAESSLATDEAAWAATRDELLEHADTEWHVLKPSAAETWDETTAASGGTHTRGTDPLPLGLAVHDALETVPFDADESEIAAHAAQAANAQDSDARSVAELVANALSMPFAARARQADNMIREAQVMAAIGTRPPGVGGDLVTITGRCDLILREGDTLTIVDYKTDDITPAEADERVEVYRNQAALYAAALTRATHMSVAEVVFAFVSPQVEVSIPVDDELFALVTRLENSP